MPETLTLDLDAARDLWKRLAPLPYRKVIDAEPESVLREKEKKCSTKRQRENENRSFCALLYLSYFFDPRRGRYLAGDRRLLTDRGIAQARNTFAERVANQMGAMASRYVDKSIGLPEYVVGMEQKIAAAHTAAYAVGRGGIPQLAGDALADAEAVVSFHLAKFEGFVGDLRRGDVSNEATIARARLYGASLAPTTEAGRSDTFKRIAESGVRIEERNVLGDAEHCHATGNVPGCFEESQKGWRPYGELSRPGQRRCLVNCRCSMAYRTVQN